MGVKTLGHVHLRGTDHHASVTLGEVVEAAGRFGFDWIDITPHLRDPSNPHQPPTIPFDRLGERWERAPRTAGDGGSGVQLGVETNIVPSYDGDWLFGVHLDVEPDTPLAWPVIASYHFTSKSKLGWPKERDSETCPQQDPGWMLRGYLELLKDYLVPLDLSVIGHPFEYSAKPPTPEQVGRLAQAVKEVGAMLEINVRRLLRIAKPTEEVLQQKVWLLRPPYLDVLTQTGVGLYLGTDIHNPDELQHLNNVRLVAEYLINHGVREEQIVGWED